MLTRSTRVGYSNLAAIALASVLIAGCNTKPAENAATQGAAGTTGPLAGSVTSDGSSTVMPVSKAMADAFMKVNPGVKVSVQASGTGGSFKKFCAGQLDVAAASRPIKSALVR